jgi:methylglutaconyl-CoA hydratase
MANYQFIEITLDGPVATLWLNRPEVRNAFHEGMIKEIIQGFEELAAMDLRLVILRGRGQTFCAGADLNWLKEVVHYSYEQNIKESQTLANCFKTIYDCPHPTLAWVHGAAMGGGIGLLASCDMAYAEPITLFSFSEVKMGIIPACISPYVIKRIGEFHARELMITGKRFMAKEAEHYQLINQSVKPEELSVKVNEIVKCILSSAPNAVKQVKSLINNVCNHWNWEEAPGKTAELIAAIRINPEAQEGMDAYLNKRPPSWILNQ